MQKRSTVTRVADMRVTSEVTAHTYSNGILLTCAMTSKLKALGGEGPCTYRYFHFPVRMKNRK